MGPTKALVSPILKVFFREVYQLFLLYALCIAISEL